MEFWLAFVPLFVAVDPIGGLPLFVGLTERLAPERRRRVIVQSMLTALAVAFAVNDFPVPGMPTMSNPFGAGRP